MGKDLLLVDERDELVRDKNGVVCTKDKIACHKFEGDLHRAYMVMVYNPEGGLLLAQRARDKPLWPGGWDGSIASHVYEHEGMSEEDSYLSAARKRIPEELGISLRDLKYVGRFRYKDVDPGAHGEVRVENEVCAIIDASYDPKNGDLDINPDEISNIQWASKEFLETFILNHNGGSKPFGYVPWLKYALERKKASKEGLKKDMIMDFTVLNDK